jgi:hypothetical protein
MEEKPETVLSSVANFWKFNSAKSAEKFGH